MIHQSGGSTRHSHSVSMTTANVISKPSSTTQENCLMIQIIVFLEILTSCFVRSEMIWLG